MLCVASSEVNLTRIRKARIWPQKHRSGNTTWKVLVGQKHDGRDEIHSFPTEAAASHFMQEWNAKLLAKHSEGLADLNHLARTEVLAALAKLDNYGATITEAVDFYIRHAKPVAGKITTQEAVAVFLEAKTKLGRRPAYLKNCRKTFYLPFARAFPKTIVSEITPTQAENYINSHNNWNSTSRGSHISYLRTLYEFLIKKGYAKLNPFRDLEKASGAASSAPKILTPKQAKDLLQFALNEGSKPECAAMTLVFFCGVRVEEVERMTWENVSFDSRKVEISSRAAKTGRRRVNDVSPNALEWLNLCRSDGKIAPNDYSQRMQRLRKRAAVPYPQNAMRHSFCAYHISKFQNANTTAMVLGHPNAQLLYRTYYEMVQSKAAEDFFSIVPDSVSAEQERQRKREDSEEREWAESQSNCGCARKEDGNWVPVQDESLS